MVGVQRFELWTPGSQNRCSTRLSYTPMLGELDCPQKKRKHLCQTFSAIDVFPVDGHNHDHVQIDPQMAAGPE